MSVTLSRYAPESPGRIVLAGALALGLGFGVALVSPLGERAAVAHVLVGGAVAFALLARQPSLRAVVGVALYCAALLTVLFPLDVFVWPLFAGGGEAATVLGGMVIVLPAAVIVAGVLAGVGWLVINYS